MLFCPASQRHFRRDVRQTKAGNKVQDCRLEPEPATRFRWRGNSIKQRTGDQMNHVTRFLPKRPIPY
jgi:hypothetical protein